MPGDRQFLSDLKPQNSHRWFGKAKGCTSKYFDLEVRAFLVLFQILPLSHGRGNMGLENQGVDL